MSTPRNLGTKKRKRAETATDNTMKDHKELIAALVPEFTQGVVSELQAMGVLGKKS